MRAVEVSQLHAYRRTALGSGVADTSGNKTFLIIPSTAEEVEFPASPCPPYTLLCNLNSAVPAKYICQTHPYASESQQRQY